MPHHRIAGQLGAHQVNCKSTLITRVPTYPERRVEQEVTLRIDGKGHFAAVKHTDPQYGQEVIWTGKWLYPRLRHGQFLRRQPTARGEPVAIADRMYGMLPAYIDLLARFLAVERVGEVKHDGRNGIKVRLRLRDSPQPARPAAGPARAWRRHIVARSIAGSAVLCARTGVPLSVELEASWSFHPPAGGDHRSGIPRGVDERTVGQARLLFEQKITNVGGKIAIQPPSTEEIKPNIRRIRLEVERQMLTGERRVTGRVDDHEDEGDGD